ncbi:MAG: polysaccharide deacetylase family protein, partial [Saprospiraceae bacterium]
DLIKLDVIAFKTRFLVVFGLKKDPYLSYNSIQNIGLPKESILFFVLSGGQTKFDKNQKLNHKAVLPLLEEISKIGEISLHPSYEASTDCSLLEIEKTELESVCKKFINKSRFHFIRLKFPKSYECLILNKIIHDYSMGYPDLLGFRAGTCHSLFWYNLQNETITNLRLHPFVAMDRTLCSYLKYDYNAAMTELLKLKELVKSYSGEFHLIWHNSSFDEHSEFLPYKALLLNFLGQEEVK